MGNGAAPRPNGKKKAQWVDNERKIEYNSDGKPN